MRRMPGRPCLLGASFTLASPVYNQAGNCQAKETSDKVTDAHTLNI